jgi:hypothetical protein
MIASIAVGFSQMKTNLSQIYFALASFNIAKASCNYNFSLTGFIHLIKANICI